MGEEGFANDMYDNSPLSTIKNSYNSKTRKRQTSDFKWSNDLNIHFYKENKWPIYMKMFQIISH